MNDSLQEGKHVFPQHTQPDATFWGKMKPSKDTAMFFKYCKHQVYHPLGKCGYLPAMF